MALDLATEKIYTVSVKLGAAPPATAAAPPTSFGFTR